MKNKYRVVYYDKILKMDRSRELKNDNELRDFITSRIEQTKLYGHFRIHFLQGDNHA